MAVSGIPTTSGVPSTIPQRFRPLFQQAVDEGQVRYGGELAGLLSVLDQARGDYQTGLGQARAASDMIQNASLTQQHALAAPDNPLTGLLAHYNPGAAGSAGVVARNMGLTVGAAAPLLAQHAVDAATAAKYQGTQLRDQYLGTVGKVQQQGQSLQDQLGSYISGRYGSLVTDDRQRRAEANRAAAQLAAAAQRAQLAADVQMRGQDITQSVQMRGQDITQSGQQLAHTDRQAAIQQRRDAANQSKAPKPAPGTVQGAFKDNVSYAQSAVSTLLKSPTFQARPRPEQRRLAAQALVNGVPTANGVPGINRVSPLAASVALDLAFDQHVSRHNRQAIYDRFGTTAARLGYPILNAATNTQVPIGLGGVNVALPTG